MILISVIDLKVFAQQEKLQLELVVEVARHGERAPKKIYSSLAIGPNFEVGSKELTITGAQNHYKIGQALRKSF